MPVTDRDLFSPRIRLSRCDVRTIKQLKALFRNKKGIENEVTYVIHKYSSALNNYTIQAAIKKDTGQIVRMRRLICAFVVRTCN